MTELFVNFVQILIILFRIKRIDSLFVSIGDYSNESIPGLNSPECGLSVKPIVFKVSLNNKCFRNTFEDKTIVFFDKPKVKPQINQRVLKGVDVKNVNQTPWAVHVGPKHWFYKAGTCTGVLITPHWVLTAAHCFEKIKNNWLAGVWLNMGSNKKKGTHKIHIEPQDFHSHPMYTNPSLPNQNKSLTEEQKKYVKSRNDIALIRVPGFISDITNDNKYFINTICLPFRHQVNYDKENVTFYGYGIIDENRNVQNYLQMAWVILTPYNWCDKMFCGHFLDDDPRPCEGDSGGPLVQYVPGTENRAILIGILQGAAPKNATCSNQIKIGYWTPVSKHIDWILKTMKENYS